MTHFQYLINIEHIFLSKKQVVIYNIGIITNFIVLNIEISYNSLL